MPVGDRKNHEPAIRAGISSQRSSNDRNEPIGAEDQAPHSVHPVPDVLHRVHRSREHLGGRSDDAEGARADADRARAHLLGIRLSVRRHADRRRLAVGSVRPAPRARGAEPPLGDGHHPDRRVLERRVARRVPRARRRRRRRCVSNGDARVHLLAAGSRAGLRAGHHPQLRAARRRGHAADRPRDRGTIRVARGVLRARRGEPGVDGRLGGVIQGHAGGAPMGYRIGAGRNPRRRRMRRARPADRRRGARSSAACGSSPSSTSATDGRCGCS